MEVHGLGERVDDQVGLKVVSPGLVVYKDTHHVVSRLFSLLQCLHCHLSHKFQSVRLNNPFFLKRCTYSEVYIKVKPVPWVFAKEPQDSLFVVARQVPDEPCHSGLGPILVSQHSQLKPCLCGLGLPSGVPPC